MRVRVSVRVVCAFACTCARACACVCTTHTHTHTTHTKPTKPQHIQHTYGLVCVWRGQVESFKYTIHKHTCVVQESHQDGPEIVVQYKVVKFSSDT